MPSITKIRFERLLLAENELLKVQNDVLIARMEKKMYRDLLEVTEKALTAAKDELLKVKNEFDLYRAYVEKNYAPLFPTEPDFEIPDCLKPFDAVKYAFKFGIVAPRTK